ncbi:MAG: 5-formyltetrahydrofolate cyclo-ligase [Pseudomonadota bacterium]
MTRQRLSKSDLRLTFLEQRIQLSPEARRKSAAAAFDLFFRHVSVPSGAVVAGYWPIRAELDDLPILRELLRRNHVCALPHVAGSGKPLVFRAWDLSAPMTTGKFNIAEPKAGSVVIPDIILVPMAVFDARGHRIGYGTGFYDMTLAQAKKAGPVLAVGLAYESQAYDELPADKGDIRMDVIVTDEKIRPFGGQLL